MGKKRKHEQNGMTSMPTDEIPTSSDTFPSSICDVLIQFKETIQVKVKTDELLEKLEERVGMLEEKLKINERKEVWQKKRITKLKGILKRKIDEFKEEFWLGLQKKIQNLEENVENKSKQSLNVFMEDFKKEQEVKEEPYLGIQEEMQKDVRAQVHHYNESPSLRSEPHQSQTRCFHLEFTCKMDTTVYKGKPIRAIEVVLFDGANQIAPDHHLASAVVELVVIDGEFSGRTGGYWSKDEFLQNIVKLRQVNNSVVDPPKFRVKNGRFQLVGGRSHHEGVVIMENSNRRDVKLGVMIVGDPQERVLEGVSNIFRVQEAKTEKGQVKQNIPPKTGTVNLPNIPNRSGMTDHHTSGTQHSFLQTEHNFGIMPNQLQKTHPHTSGYGPGGQPLVDHPRQQNTTIQGATQQKDHGQGKEYTRTINFPNMPMPSEIPHYHTAGNGYVGSLPVEHSQYRTQQDITGVGSYGSSAGRGQQYMQPRTCPISFPNMPTPSEIPYQHISGNGYVGPLPSDLQYHRQQDITGVGSYATMQGPQNTSLRTEHNLGTVPNQLQKRHTHTAGNTPGTQPLDGHPQQQNSTQQGSTQQEDHGSDLAFNNWVEAPSTDIITMSPFADNAYEDDVTFTAAMRSFARSADYPVAPEDAYQDGGPINRSGQAPESTQMEFTQPRALREP